MPDATPGPAASALARISAELRTFGASDEDTRRLLKAIEAALAHHVEAVIEDMPEPRFRYCKTCSGHPAWPCPEVAATTAELAGEAGDAR